jgi:crotonobetainyl-CoA:carnitine CoA-transferase CaiB-like acyl-CoA transferase
MSTGTPETPSKAGFSVADLGTGMFAFSGILTALYDRERTGAGATLRVSLLDALGELMMQPAYFSATAGSRREEQGRGIRRSRRTARSRSATVRSFSVSRTNASGTSSAAMCCTVATWQRILASRATRTAWRMATS